MPYSFICEEKLLS